MEDLNSSDIEFDAPPRNPFHNAGKASVMAMLDHALDDRIASKRQVKQLAFVKGTPATQIDSVPESEDLERFFTTIVSRVQPRTNQVPAYSWLKGAVGFTIENCVFHHKTFTLSPHERSRISTLLDSLLQQGKLTQDPSWERNWVGTVVVRKLVESLVNQAIQNGTMAWDITIAKCLSIVLVAAIGARTGDVTVAPLDRHTLPYLAYKDIVIKMKGGSTIDDLDAVLTLRNEKGDKLDPKKKRIILLKASKSSSDSLVCPIKLLLALALRLGNVPETSIEDLIKHTAQRKNQTVVWSFPERPVLCAFGTNGASVTTDKPAGNHQLTYTMAEARLAAGLLSQVHAHDLRRGAARDTAHLHGKATGVANKMATVVLGHNSSSANRPLTAHYVGAHDEDVWTKRLERNYTDSFYELPEAEDRYQRKFQAFSAQDITKVCVSETLDDESPKDRAKVSRLLEKRRQADWADQENRKKQMLAVDLQDPPLFPTADTMGTSVMSEDSPTMELNATGEFAIDPQLIQQSQQLCNVITGAEDGVANPGIEGLVFDAVQGLASPTGGLETCDTLSFVRRFSTINISCNQTLAGWGKKVALAKEKTLSLMEGNSRDKVTSFVYACKNHVYGCAFRNAFRVEINRHEQACLITSSKVFDQLAQKETTKTFKCTKENCSKSYGTIGKLNSHMKEMHEYPRPCPKGCVGMLNSRSEYSKHMESHSAFKPTNCLVPGCKSTTTFERSKIYRKHVRDLHGIRGKDIDQYMPFEKKAKFEPMQCGVEGCPSRATFKLPNMYKKHLREHHDMEEYEIEFYLSIC